MNRNYENGRMHEASMLKGADDGPVGYVLVRNGEHQRIHHRKSDKVSVIFDEDFISNLSPTKRAMFFKTAYMEKARLERFERTK